MAQTERPNIIFILADDMGYGDLGCFGSKVIHTPNIDQMAAEGIKLTQFYSGSTVCSPSRNSFLTGQHTGHVYIRGNEDQALRPEDLTVAEVLRASGYQTGLFGKWGLGDIHTTGEPSKKGWDTFYGLLHNVEAHFQFPGIAWKSTPAEPELQRIRAKAEDGFGCNFYRDMALEWIDQRDLSKPFFAFLSFPIPHAELVAPKEALKPYQKANGESIFEEKPFIGSHYGGQPMPKAAYAALVSKLDSYVGDVMSYLKAHDLDKNTIVILTSDNGTHIEGGRTRDDVELMQSSGEVRGVKRDLYEGGIRVPAVVWGGPLPKGVINSTPGAFWDLLPTFCEATATIPPKHIDGISLWQNWQNKEVVPERPLYWEFYERGFSKAVRLGNWKYIYQKNLKGEIKEELFNLQKDVKELENLSLLYPDILLTLKGLSEQMHSTSAVYRME